MGTLEPGSPGSIRGLKVDLRPGRYELLCNMSGHYLGGMLKRNRGRVIFISSESGVQIPVEMVHYGMTKAAQLAISRGLAIELTGTGVTVNTVLPGPTRTENTGGSFNDALQAAAEGRVPMLNTRSEKAIASFVAMLDELQGKLDDELGDLVEAVLERTGYRRELEASSDPQDLARLDNLNELVSVAHEFSIDLANAQALAEEEPVDEDIPDTGVLAQFLERVSLVADADELPEEGAGVVTMMTLHTAKGLEFPVVFVTGWEDGMFPHMRALGDPTELSEERRLAYVGITRARQRLYVSRARVRSS